MFSFHRHWMKHHRHLLVVALALLLPLQGGIGLVAAQEVRFEHFADLDLPGGDMFDMRQTDAFKGISQQECELECAKRPLCKAYTWNSENFWCFMKVFVASRSTHQGAFSGIKRQALDAAPALGNNDGPAQSDAYGNQVAQDTNGSAPNSNLALSVEPNGKGVAYRVQNTKLNARSGPGGDHEVIARLESGDKLKELERRDEWSHVVLADGRRAWVHNGYISKPFDLRRLAKPQHPDPVGLSSFLPKDDYLISSRVGFSTPPSDIRFDDKHGLLWMASGNNLRAYTLEGGMVVKRTLGDNEKARVFAPGALPEHPLYNWSKVVKDKGELVLQDDKTKKILFRFDYRKGKGDKALFAQHLNVPPALLSYAYYKSGMIRIWDIERKVLVSEYKRPKGAFPISGAISRLRYMRVDTLRAARKLTKKENAIGLDGLRQSWSNVFWDTQDRFLKGMKQIGIVPRNKIRVMDLITGKVGKPLDPIGQMLKHHNLLDEPMVVARKPIYLAALSHLEREGGKMRDVIAAWDFASGKLIWSYETRENGLLDFNRDPLFQYNVKADRIVLSIPEKGEEGNVSTPIHKLQVRKLSTGKVLGELSVDPLRMTNGFISAKLAISDDGKILAVGGTQGEVMLLDLAEQKQLWSGQARAFDEYVEEERVDYNPDWELNKPDIQSLLAGAMPDKVQGTARVYPDTPDELDARNEKAGLELVTVLEDHLVKGWKLRDINSGKILYMRKHDGESFDGIAFTPSGEHFALLDGKDGKKRFRVIEARTNKKVYEIRDSAEEWAFHGSRSVSEAWLGVTEGNVVFSSNGHWIFITGKEIGWKLVNIASGKKYKLKPRSTSGIIKMGFDRHNRYLILPNSDGSVQLTDLQALKNRTFRASEDLENDYNFTFLTSKSGSRAVQFTKGVFRVWDLVNRKVERQFSIESDLDNNVIGCSEPLRALSDDGRFISLHFCQDGNDFGEIWDADTGRRVARMDFTPTRFSPKGDLAYGATGINHVHVARVRDGAKMAEVMAFEDGSWITLTPQGFFNASGDGAKKISIIKDLKTLSVDQAYDALYRPDLLKEALRGDPDAKLTQAGERLDLAAVLSSGLPPLIRSVATKSDLEADQTEVTIAIDLVARSGGIGRLDVRVNGNVQTVCDTESGACRGLGAAIELAPEEGRSIERQVILRPGRNVIEVVAYNKANQIASQPKQLALVAEIDESGKSDLHILAIGIDDYYDSALKLDYAIADANGIIDGFTKAGHGYFDQVHVTKVFNDAATFDGISKAFDKVARVAKPKDVFLFYIAGHGKSQEGHYYFLPQDFVDKGQGSIESQGIGREKWRDWFSRILADKSVLVYDTCESGSLVTNQSRSLTNRAVADRLKRATGRSTLAATSEKGVALEGIGGHGVFTFTLLEGLAEADNDNDNFVELTELAGYVQKRLPELSHEYFGYRQLPETQVVNSFPLGKKTRGLVQSSDLFIPSSSTHVVIMPVEVRDKASGESAVKEKLKPGTLVRLLDSQEGWVKIARNGQLLGFVPANSIVAQQ